MRIFVVLVALASASLGTVSCSSGPSSTDGGATAHDASPDGAFDAAQGSPDAAIPARPLLYFADWDSGLYRGEDLNADGDLGDENELVRFYQPDSDPTVQFPSIAVFAVDYVVATDVLYYPAGPIMAFVDRNLDGDADDAGEISEWWSAPTSDDYVSTPGLGMGPDGAVYVVYQETDFTFTQSIRVLRLVDSNLDGDAKDDGESEIVAAIDPADLSTPEEEISAFTVGDDGDLWLWGDWGHLYRYRMQNGTLERVFDNLTDGTPTADFTYWSPGLSIANVVEELGLAADGRVLFHARKVTPSGEHGLAAAADLDNDGTLDGAGELTLAWDGGALAKTEGFFARTGGYTISLVNTGEDLFDKQERSVASFQDLNADGDFDDADEMIVLFDEDDLPAPMSSRVVVDAAGR